MIFRTTEPVSNHRTQVNMLLKTSDVSVSNTFIFSNLFLCFLSVDKPEMQPRKDYDDYTTFINDTFNEKKVAMLHKSMGEKGFKNKESRTQTSNPYA